MHLNVWIIVNLAKSTHNRNSLHTPEMSIMWCSCCPMPKPKHWLVTATQLFNNDQTLLIVIQEGAACAHSSADSCNIRESLLVMRFITSTETQMWLLIVSMEGNTDGKMFWHFFFAKISSKAQSLLSEKAASETELSYRSQLKIRLVTTIRIVFKRAKSRR